MLTRIDGLDTADVTTPIHPLLEQLTAREREIAEQVAIGNTNRQIGEALYISEHTVRNHLVAIFDKLGVQRRAELARLLTSTKPSPHWPQRTAGS